MTITRDSFLRLNETFKKNVEASVEQLKTDLPEMLTHIEDIYVWSQLIKGPESELIPIVCEQLVHSTYCILSGQYRSGKHSLRLALELSLATIYFSAHNIDFREWKLSKKDITWSALTSEESGVFSDKFSSIYNPSLSKKALEYLKSTKEIYRSLSEYVHGNPSTLENPLTTVSIEPAKSKESIGEMNRVITIIHFAIVFRYLNETITDKKAKEKIETPTLEMFGSISEIRRLFQ